ncbi:MAG: hypothetical protein Q7R56_02045 [Nanoarchaeota archaeon]|nr:hypothetical protein [Nanoarchaeota archaeon]
MVATEVLINVLSIVFAMLGMMVVFRWVFPKLADVLDAVVEDQVAVDGVLVLLKVFVGVFVLGLVVTVAGKFHASIPPYVGTVQQGLSVITSITKYVEWLVVGVGALLLVKVWKKSK